MAYTSSSASDRLNAVRAAIDRCLAAESYTIRGREKRSATLDSLMKAESRLMEQVAIESNSGQMASVARYVKPR